MLGLPLGLPLGLASQVRLWVLPLGSACRVLPLGSASWVLPLGSCLSGLASGFATGVRARVLMASTLDNLCKNLPTPYLHIPTKEI